MRIERNHHISSGDTLSHGRTSIPSPGSIIPFVAPGRRLLDSKLQTKFLVNYSFLTKTSFPPQGSPTFIFGPVGGKLGPQEQRAKFHAVKQRPFFMNVPVGSIRLSYRGQHFAGGQMSIASFAVFPLLHPFLVHLCEPRDLRFLSAFRFSIRTESNTHVLSVRAPTTASLLSPFQGVSTSFYQLQRGTISRLVRGNFPISAPPDRKP